MYTEEEAKTKGCPIAELKIRPPSALNTGCCDGSECMLWRWETRLALSHLGVDMGTEITGYGYCGLAGKPEE